MKDNFDYSTVPVDYLHCLHAQCPQAGGCLRHLVALRATKETVLFKTINPIHVVEEEKCRFFQPDQMARFAKGITHLYDDLPHKKAVSIRSALVGYFGRSIYYRVRGKERMLKPEDVAFVCQQFRKEGIKGEPQFDECFDQYAW